MRKFFVLLALAMGFGFKANATIVSMDPAKVSCPYGGTHFRVFYKGLSIVSWATPYNNGNDELDNILHINCGNAIEYAKKNSLVVIIDTDSDPSQNGYWKFSQEPAFNSVEGRLKNLEQRVSVLEQKN